MNYREISWFLTHQKNVCSIPFKWWCKMSIFKGGGTRSGGRISALPATPNSALSSNNIPRIAIMLSKKKNFQITDFKQKSHIPWGKNALPFERDRAYIFLTLISQFFWIKWFFKIFQKNIWKKFTNFEISICLIFIVIIFMKIDFVRSYSVRHFKNSVVPPHPIQCCHLTLYVFHRENRHFRWKFDNESTFSKTYKKCVSHFLSNSGYMFS